MRENFQINTFKLSDLTNQYSNRGFAFIVSTEFHTPKNEESFTHLQNMKFYRFSKNDIFQEISEADQMFNF